MNKNTKLTIIVSFFALTFTFMGGTYFGMGLPALFPDWAEAILSEPCDWFDVVYAIMCYGFGFYLISMLKHIKD